jgi:hypothetical protein
MKKIVKQFISDNNIVVSDILNVNCETYYSCWESTVANKARKLDLKTYF